MKPSFPPPTSSSPTLSPEEARLVIAHRLGDSSYHSLEHADDSVLEKLNLFGGRRQKLFSGEEDESKQLVFMIDGATDKTSYVLEKELGAIKPDFLISDPPSFEANKQLATDIQSQFEAVDVMKDGGIISLDVSQDSHDLADAINTHREIYSGLVVILYPKSTYKAKHSAQPYGTYELPSPLRLSRRQEQAEEPIIAAVSSEFVVPGAAYSPAESAATKLPKVVPMCFASMESCVTTTNNCSGHGACFQKHSGSDGGSAASKPCFACGCVATVETKNGSNTTTNWGGGACSKIDISSPFWLISGFTIVMVFLVSWAIGMLFSIGEEKLPGVIGAGVSGAKTR